MKRNYYSGNWARTYPFTVHCNALLVFLSVIIALVDVASFAQGVSFSSNKLKPEDIIASIRANTFDTFDNLAANVIDDRTRFINELRKIFNDTKSSNYQQCAAAFYLGEMRASEAAYDLAVNIKLSMDHSLDHATILTMAPTVTALVKIGNTSIPAVIRNLAESDDAQVRDLSLKVLYRIEGDKDIVQLRLQKALNVEKDLQKQARLQTALKFLADTQFNK